jgi:hypothetical protein
MLPNINFLMMVIYLVPAIIHIDRFYPLDLLTGSLKDTQPHLHEMLLFFELVDESSRLTALGNEIFGYTKLIEYSVKTGIDMAFDKEPTKRPELYDILRVGLSQQAKANAIPLIQFLHEELNEDIDTIADIGGGAGEYLKLIGAHFGIEEGFLIDKTIKSASENLITATFPVQFMEGMIDEEYYFHDTIIDLALINEVLHLGGDAWKTQVIARALGNLQNKGYICIGENHQCSALDWRLKTYADSTTTTPGNIRRILDTHFHGVFEVHTPVLETSTHWFLLLQVRSNT